MSEVTIVHHLCTRKTGHPLLIAYKCSIRYDQLESSLHSASNSVKKKNKKGMSARSDPCFIGFVVRVAWLYTFNCAIAHRALQLLPLLWVMRVMRFILAGVTFHSAARSGAHAVRRSSQATAPLSMAIRAVESYNADFELEEKVLITMSRLLTALHILRNRVQDVGTPEETIWYKLSR